MRQSMKDDIQIYLTIGATELIIYFYKRDLGIPRLKNIILPPIGQNIGVEFFWEFKSRSKSRLRLDDAILKQDFLKVLYSTSTNFFLTVKSATDPLASIDTTRGETYKLSCFKRTRTGLAQLWFIKNVSTTTEGNLIFQI